MKSLRGDNVFNLGFAACRFRGSESSQFNHRPIIVFQNENYPDREFSSRPLLLDGVIALAAMVGKW